MIQNEIGAFHFQVDLGDGGRAGFAEVSGLDAEVAVIEYRNGDERVFTPRKLPGIAKYANVTLIRGSLPGDEQLWSWIDESIAGRPEPRDVIVKLLDVEHQPVRAWQLVRAWPVSYSVATLSGTASEIAMESLELAHEGLSLVDL